MEEAGLSQVAVGDSVRLSFDADLDGALACDGTVTEISYLGQDSETGATYTAYVEFDVPEGVRLGMAVTATVAGGRMRGGSAMRMIREKAYCPVDDSLPAACDSVRGSAHGDTGTTPATTVQAATRNL